MTVFPVLYVRPNSENIIASNGPNALAGGTGLTDNTGTLLTSAVATAYLTITNPQGTVRLNQGAMSYISPGLWSYTTAASVLPEGDGPWTATIQVFDQTGTGGTLYATFYLKLIESAT